MNRTAEFSPPPSPPGRIRALLMDLDIKKWEYCFYAPSTAGRRTQMYFDNKASKHDTAHDKFSRVYLHPSKKQGRVNSKAPGDALLSSAGSAPLRSSGTAADERTLRREQKVVSASGSPWVSKVCRGLQWLQGVKIRTRRAGLRNPEHFYQALAITNRYFSII